MSHLPLAKLFSTASLAALIITGPALAQEAPAPRGTAPETKSDVEIIVTGSRIYRPELQASVPVSVVSNDTIQRQASANVADILNELPSIGTGDTRTNANFNTTANGLSSINLRNLQTSRTIILQNGRRIVAGLGGDSTVDVNVIPTDLIDRIEVVTGGASAVYGSEAIAGVVNFILKDDFEGVRLRAQAGKTTKGDNGREMISGTFGSNFADGAGNITLFASYDRDKGLRSKNRTISAEDNPFRSGYAPQGRFFLDDPNATEDSDLSTQFTYDQAGNLKEGFDSAVDGFNRNGERYISIPVDRYNISGNAHFDFSDSVTLFAEGSYVKTKARSRLEPYPADNTDALMPDGNVYAGLTLDNPFIPDEIRSRAVEMGATEIPFFKRQAGVFDRSNRSNRDFWRAVVGLKGDFKAFDNNWNWEVSLNRGRTIEKTSSETALRDRFFYALDAINLDGETVCRDAAARADGCKPYNPFGVDSVSDGAAQYITNNGQLSTYRAQVDQQVFSANLSGSVPMFAAGPLGLAFGVEHRREKSTEIYDLPTQLGNTFGNAFENTVGKYHVTEGYAEAVLPLIADKPMAYYFGIEGAARYARYSTIGSTFTWKLGAEYAPIKSLRFRGVYSKASRAPNISELYAGRAQTFPGPLADPCDGVTATRSNAGDDYCRSIPGIAQQIALNGAFRYDDNIDQQSIEGFEGGNPNLNEEKAETLTLGAVFQPEFLPGFSMSIDYFNISIKDAITLVPREVEIEQCVLTAGASPFCNFIVRDTIGNPRSRTPGTVFQVDNFQVNAASIKTSGIDVAMNYTTRVDEDTRLTLNLAYTYLDKLMLRPLAGVPIENNRGQLDGDGRLGAGFKHRANLTTVVEWGPVEFSWKANFLSSIYDTLPSQGPALGRRLNHVGFYAYHDFQLRWKLGKDRPFEIYAGVDNALDKKPPLIDQNGASNIPGTETAADSYDAIGRSFYVGATFQF